MATLLRSCGNLNGFGPAVLAATYLPPAVGLSMVAYWAMQGHPLSQQLVAWQQNILAKAALGLSAALSLVTVLQPRLLFVTSDKEDPSSSSSSSSSTRLPDGDSQIFRIVCVWPYGLLDYGSPTLRCKI